MNIKNIKEIIFCNKNGKLAAFAKTYGNKFTEISVNEGIELAKTIDYRILKTQEEIEKLQKEVQYKSNNNTRNVAYTAVALATAASLALGVSACGLSRDSRDTNTTGATEMSQGVNSAADETATPIIVESSAEQSTADEEETVVDDEFDNLLAASQSATQRESLQMMYDYINYFNGDFANHYKETVQLRDDEGNLTGEVIEVKPSLSWEYEVPALAIAYNDYTTRELQEIFNGTELDANTLDANYKNGTLQLFGAYVISDRDHPVNLSALIESPEGQAFVQKYEDLFYNIKEAKTEEEFIEAINAFYSELYKDFPIDSYTREVGISHADSRALILDQPFKLAITPMVAATEVMYQNYAIDHTLSDPAIAYFNDLGLCNLAYSSFEKAERATESYTYDERFADYEYLSRLIINNLRRAGNYVIDDAHRDLSLLTIFQENVNGHFDVIDGEWVYVGDSAILSTTVETYQEIVDQWTESTTKTWTERTTTTTSDRDEAVALAGEDAVSEAERRVDQEIAEENERAREEAEREADEEQARQQAEEDEHARQVQEEVAHDDQDMQDKIDEANDVIDNGGTVNEDDFGDHEVDFDDEHSDEQGNLDDSVENITTDDTGAVDANDPLPDPNETGRAFDERHRSVSVPAVVENDTEAYAYDYEDVVETVVTAEPTVNPVVEATVTTDPVVEPVVQEPQSTTQVEEVQDQVETVEPVEPTDYVEHTAYEESNPVETVDYEEEDYEAVYYDFEDIDYEEEYTTTSDEDLVDAYVESLAEQPSAAMSRSL